MRILERYIFREVLQAWLAVTGVLLIVLLSNQLTTVLSRAASGEVTRDMVFLLLGLSSLQQLVVLIPIGLFLAIMLAFGRFYHESELVAMRACGIENIRLYRPVGWLSVVAAILLAGLSLVVLPNAAKQTEVIRNKALREARFASLEPGKFRVLAGGIVFYAESVDAQGFLHNVYAERNQDSKTLEIVHAARAQQLGVGEAEQTFVLYDGVRYEGIPGTAQFRIMRFAEHGIPVRLPAVTAAIQKVEMKDTAQIVHSTDLLDQAEWHWRIASPIMVLVLAFLGVPLSRLKPRQGRYAKVGFFILVYFLYANVLAAARMWIERGVLSGIWGLWWVHLIVMCLALLLWRRAGGLRAVPRRVAQPKG